MKRKPYREVKRYVIATGEEFESPEKAEKEAQNRAEKLLRAYLNKADYLDIPIPHIFWPLFELLIEQPEGMQEIIDALTFGGEAGNAESDENDG